MNRRDFLSAGFKLGAAGLLLPFIEPARKVWALDRTMIRPVDVISDYPVIGDFPGDWVLHPTEMDSVLRFDPRIYPAHSVVKVDQEFMHLIPDGRHPWLLAVRGVAQSKIQDHDFTRTKVVIAGVAMPPL